MTVYLITNPDQGVFRDVESRLRLLQGFIVEADTAQDAAKAYVASYNDTQHRIQVQDITIGEHRLFDVSAHVEQTLLAIDVTDIETPGDDLTVDQIAAHINPAPDTTYPEGASGFLLDAEGNSIHPEDADEAGPGGAL